MLLCANELKFPLPDNLKQMVLVIFATTMPFGVFTISSTKIVDNKK